MSAKRRRRPTSSPRPWGPWRYVEHSDEYLSKLAAAGLDVDDEIAVGNDRYTVIMRGQRVGADAAFLAGARVLHLSIKRNDRKPVHDWRDLQRIKNELVGPEAEAVELYPAESRLVDAANQYHLWVLVDGGWFPFGFDQGRLVSGPAEAASIGARQRPFESEGSER